MPERCELLIVGAGPAGVSAALWAKSLALDARLIEREHRAGGQLHMVHFAPPELAGIIGQDGPAIASVYEHQLRASGTAVEVDAEATRLELPGPARARVIGHDGSSYSGR